MTELRQADFVSLARDDDFDLVVLAAGAPGEGSLATAEGDVALRDELNELLSTPTYQWLYAPFWGVDFGRHANTPDERKSLGEMIGWWRRLMEGDRRVKAVTAKVRYDADADQYVFSVESALTGELVSVRAKG